MAAAKKTKPENPSWQRSTRAKSLWRCFVQRRSFLKGAGIVTVAVVGGGVWRAWDQGVFSVGEGPAYVIPVRACNSHRTKEHGFKEKDGEFRDVHILVERAGFLDHLPVAGVF